MSNGHKPHTAKGKGTIFDSIKGAAAFIGEDVSVLSEAKADGCPAFRHSKVYVQELTAWLKNRPPVMEGEEESEKTLRRRRLRGQCEKIEHELAIARGSYLSKEEVRGGLRQVGAGVRSALLDLPGQMPGRLVGLTEPQIHKILSAWVHDCLTILHDPQSTAYAS